jgi:hypothetical protein
LRNSEGAKQEERTNVGKLPEFPEKVVAVEGLLVEKLKPQTRLVQKRIHSPPVVGGNLVFEDIFYGS